MVGLFIVFYQVQVKYFFPILDEDLSYQKTLPNAPNLQHAQINDTSSLEPLHKLCEDKGINVCTEQKYKDALVKFATDYQKLKKNTKRIN